MSIKWSSIIAEEREKPYFKALDEFVMSEYSTHRVYPPHSDIYNALKLTPYDSVKAVIIGQDPYHGHGQAHGLSFSVKDGIALPPSLQNIFKEIGIDPQARASGNLTNWARQGVLLLNAVLTVREAAPNSHKGIGWETLTDRFIDALNEHKTPVVFMLWGNDAKKKETLIRNPNHLILKTVHPSPLSAHRGFFGCNHFNLANEFLIKHEMKPIEWV